MRKKTTKGEIWIFRLYNIVDLIYVLIKNSCFFWFYLLRGFIITTFLSSTRALALVSLENVHKNQGSTREEFRKKYKNTNKERFLSLLFSFGSLYLMIIVILPLPDYLNHTWIYGIKYISLALLLIGLPTLFVRHCLKENLGSLVQNFFVQIYLMTRCFGWVFFQIVLTAIIFWFSLKNVIFLFFFAPGVLGYGLTFLSTKIENKIKLMTQNA